MHTPLDFIDLGSGDFFRASRKLGWRGCLGNDRSLKPIFRGRLISAASRSQGRPARNMHEKLHLERAFPCLGVSSIPWPSHLPAAAVIFFWEDQRAMRSP
jgi:hypothetical protein